MIRAMLRTLATVTPPDTAVAIITQRKPNQDKGFEDLLYDFAQRRLLFHANVSGDHFIRRKPWNSSGGVGFCQRFVGRTRRFGAKPCGDWVSRVPAAAGENGSNARFRHAGRLAGVVSKTSHA
jgi:hypothetical protein